MSTGESSPIREQIWDYIFYHGQQSVDDLAKQLGISAAEVAESVDCDWFVVENEQVSIATGDR